MSTHERIVHATEHTIVVAVDAPDPKAGGACHCYQVRDRDGHILEVINFQHGPIGEAGVNGPQHVRGSDHDRVVGRVELHRRAVDLLAIIRDRLDCFQRGSFASPVNEVTCGFVSAAIASEETRTRRRALAGVEGTSKKATAGCA